MVYNVYTGWTTGYHADPCAFSFEKPGCSSGLIRPRFDSRAAPLSGDFRDTFVVGDFVRKRGLWGLLQEDDLSLGGHPAGYLVLLHQIPALAASVCMDLKQRWLHWAKTKGLDL